jgi:hypothetical protein
MNNYCLKIYLYGFLLSGAIIKYLTVNSYRLIIAIISYNTYYTVAVDTLNKKKNRYFKSNNKM